MTQWTTSVQLQMLVALYDHAPLEIHVWELLRDRESAIIGWRLVHANPQALASWNRSLEQVIGKTNEELFPGADSTRLFLPVVERIFSTGRPYEWEEGFSDTHQILKMTSIPVEEHFISCGMDVGEYRGVEAELTSKSFALDHSARVLKVATEAAGIGIWEYAIEDGTLVWDRSMYAIYGVEPTVAKIPYEVWRDGVHPEDIERATRELNAAIASRSIFKSDFRILRKDSGEVRYIAAQAVIEHDAARQTTRMIGVNIDRTERRRAEQDVERLAYFDTLTGLPNRARLEQQLGEVLEENACGGVSGALIFIDLDDFKQLNDSVGHARGDELLVAIARRLEGVVANGRTVGRFGGDEFVIILSRLPGDAVRAREATERFVEALQRDLSQPLELSSGKHVTSASIGVSLLAASDSDADTALRRAELAMYEAKGAGRGSTRFFDLQMEQAFIQRIHIRNDLEAAIEEQQLELHYQPQVDAEGRIRGAEALVRWRHPELGSIPPMVFIRIAEESGQIRALGRWVVRNALDTLQSRFAPLVGKSFTVSVNVSALQLYDPDFGDQLKSDVLEFAVRPEQLVIELTESALLETEADIVAKMQALKEFGLRFSLDDFGTGYSSLTRLKRLPIDELKIDQSFVRDIDTDPDSRAIAESIILMARSMGVSVIAEGVETEVHRRTLEQLGCSLYQGYYFSKPIDTDAFVDLLTGPSTDCSA